MPVVNPFMYNSPNYTPTNLPQIPMYNPQPSYRPTLPVQTSNVIAGKAIQSEADITPNEVAMDGSISLFPLGDYSAIIAKQWNANGTISTVKYVPVVDEDCTDDEPSKLDAFSEQVNKRFDELEHLLTNRNNYKKNTGGNNA